MLLLLPPIFVPESCPSADLMLCMSDDFSDFRFPAVLDHIGMAKRIVNKRDSMGNPLLGYIRVTADIQENTITIESNDIVSGIRLNISASELRADIRKEGSILLSESVCDWLRGARDPLYIVRNGNGDTGTVLCGCEKLVMKDNDFDEMEFLEIRPVPDEHEEISVSAASFCRACVPVPSTLMLLHSHRRD